MKGKYKRKEKEERRNLLDLLVTGKNI